MSKKWKKVVLYFSIEIIAILMTIYGVMNFRAILHFELKNSIALVFLLVGFPASVTVFALILSEYVIEFFLKRKEKQNAN